MAAFGLVLALSCRVHPAFAGVKKESGNLTPSSRSPCGPREKLEIAAFVRSNSWIGSRTKLGPQKQ